MQTSLCMPGIYGMLQLVTDGNEEWGVEGSCVQYLDRGALLGSGFPSVLSESGAGLQKGMPDKLGGIVLAGESLPAPKDVPPEQSQGYSNSASVVPGGTGKHCCRCR